MVFSEENAASSRGHREPFAPRHTLVTGAPIIFEAEVRPGAIRQGPRRARGAGAARAKDNIPTTTLGLAQGLVDKKQKKHPTQFFYKTTRNLSERTRDAIATYVVRAAQASSVQKKNQTMSIVAAPRDARQAKT